MGDTSIIDAPVLQAADNYTAQIADERGIFTTAKDFISATGGAVAADTYNSTGAVIKFFGGDGWHTDTHDVIDAYDSGAASFYDTHKGLIDGASLLAGSILPGTLGIKALRAAQSGASGSKILSGLGFNMVNPSKLNAARVLAEGRAAQSATTWNALNSDLSKALVLGAASNALDFTAFGIGALATTNTSPVYDGMTPLDLVKNTLWDSALMGGIGGGAFSAGKTFFGLKKAATAADLSTIHGRLIDIGAGLTPEVRIPAIIKGVADAKVANGGDLPADSMALVHDYVHTLARGIAGEDEILGKQIGDFAVKFMDDPVNAANMFAKLQRDGISRFVRDDAQGLSRPLTGQQMLVDTVDGSIYGREADATYHFRDYFPKDTTFSLGANNTVKVNTPAGMKSLVVDATGNFRKGDQMTASWLRAAMVPNLPKEVAIVIDNIPMAERAIEEAAAAKSAGKEFTTSLVDAAGNRIADIDEAVDALKQIKDEAISRLGKFETPENIAARLNISSDYLLHPENNAVSLRPFKGKDSILSFLTSPRIAVASYDIGNKEVPIKSGINKGQLRIVKNKFTGYKIGDVENAFDTALQGNIAKERLVTTPASPDANTSLYEQQASQYIANVMKAVESAQQIASEQILPELKAAPTAGEIADALETGATRAGLGTHTMTKSADNAYGSLGSFLQKVGQITKRASDTAKLDAQNAMAAASNLIAKDVELGNEWQLLAAKLGSSSGKYIIDPTGANRLLRQDIAINAKRAAEAAGISSKFHPVEAMEGDEFIPVTEKLLNEVLIPHTELNNMRLTNRIKMDNQLMPGSSGNAALEAGLSPVYAPPVNTSRYSHFLFIRDANKLVGNGGGVGMLIAKDAEQLAVKKAALEKQFPNRFEFITKGNTKAYYKSLGEYQYSRGMNESFVDSALQRTGMLADITPNLSVNGNIEAANELLSFHQRMAVREVRDAVELRYANPIGQLQFLGKQADDLALSKFSPEKVVEIQARGIRNPYHDAVNMMLNVGNADEFPMWRGLNAFTEKLGDNVFSAVRNGWDSLVNSGLTEGKLDAEVAKYNKAAQRVGLEPLYTNMAVSQFKEQLAVRPMLRSFIARAQAGLNGLMLGLDPMQAINNGLGQVMFAAEFRSLINMIEKEQAGAGALAGLLKVQIPGMDYSINSAIKLHANATRRFLSGGKVWDETAKDWVQVSRDALRKEYTDEGLLTTIAQQYHQAVDDLTLSAKNLSDAELTAKWDRFLEGCRTLTGNRLAEEYTRFVAADAARMLTDAAMAVGKIDSKAIARTYWNTAVNRIHGVNVASQRAVLFHGVIGQSIGMFMTYQHNLMQQLFRYAAEGDTPAMVALGASQLGLYGIQGLPAFNAISTHLIGNASGNTGHTDAYTWTAKNLSADLPYKGGNVAEWILYGGASNMLGLVSPDLKVNLYSRGDINPRQITVFPTSIENTVAYSASVGAVKNMFDVVSNIAGGAPVLESVLHGLEHNNINRPFSGLGAVLSGTQTSASGTKLADVKGATGIDTSVGGGWDKFNLSNFMRIAGAKPLDDAASADAMYRVTAYQAADTASRRQLAERMRISSQEGRTPSAEEMQTFMQDYAKIGGSIRGFRAFAAQTYKTANTNQVMELALKMRSAGSQQVAAILGATSDQAWLDAAGGGI